MFSGGDSTGEGVNGMNPFGNFQLASQSAAACGLTAPTTASGSIDWASLAQQWIQMRDNSGADIGSTMPDAPPPPKISPNFNNEVVERRNSKNYDVRNPKKSRFEEKGEADMDMDDDDDNARSAQNNMPIYCDRVPSVDQVMQPNWFVHHPIGAMAPAADMSKEEQNQQSGSQWNPWPPRSMLPTPIVNANITPPMGANSTAHIPSLMKINVPDPNIIKSMSENSIENNSSSTMDAAKRKILPAWIREGLEKMEREKQREMERKQKKLNAPSEDDSNSQTATDTPPLRGPQMVNNKFTSTLESDSSGNEEDGNERTLARTATSSIEKFKSASQSYTDAEEEDQRTEKVIEAVITGKSYEHKLSDLMIVVRKTLTELLLEVTNEEICSISNEAIKSLKNKATSAQVIPKSAISTITGKLGLAAYGYSSEESSGSDDEESNIHDSYADSEEEIKANLKMKRKAFAKTSEEIEERIAESALREEQKLKFHTEQEAEEQQKLKIQLNRDNQHEFERSGSSSSHNFKNSGRSLGSKTTNTSGKGFEKEFGETTDSKLQFSNGKRQKERTTRFSDIKDLKNIPMKSADYISQFKNSQIETAVQKINTAILHIPLDAPTSSVSSTITPTKYIDTLPPFNAMLSMKRDSNPEDAIKHKQSKSESNKKSRHRSSDDNDEDDSTSDSTDSSDSSSNSSNSSHNSSKSGISSRSTKTKGHHYHRSSSYAKKSSRDHKNSHSRDYRDRHYDNHKSSRHRYHSSDSDDYDEGDYHSENKHRSSRSTHHRHERYPERSHTRTRSRSNSRSRSRSTYSSSRRRH